jgi:hypothetical protein
MGTKTKRKTQAVNETSLVEAALRHIRKWDRARPPSAEVAILGRSADLAFLVNDDLITVECKVSDWRRALRQARDHKIVADYAYICLHLPKVTDALRDATGQEGIGVVLWDRELDTFSVVIPARRSEKPWAAARTEVIAKLRTECESDTSRAD